MDHMVHQVKHTILKWEFEKNNSRFQIFNKKVLKPLVNPELELCRNTGKRSFEG